jgi:hypothetical protein
MTEMISGVEGCGGFTGSPHMRAHDAGYWQPTTTLHSALYLQLLAIPARAVWSDPSRPETDAPMTTDATGWPHRRHPVLARDPRRHGRPCSTTSESDRDD